MIDKRQQQLYLWLTQVLQPPIEWTPIVGHMSHRRYFRVTDSFGNCYVAMDAPFNKGEQVEPFIVIAKVLQQAGVIVPEIKQADTAHGFLLLSDFGSQLLLHVLSPANVTYYYEKAMAILAKLQTASIQGLAQLDAALIREELSLFQYWYLEKKLGLTLSSTDTKLLDNFFFDLAESAVQQPQRLVHWDFHAKNIMVLADDELGVLDFQDARIGPITYDLVSLLKDCYITWPRQQVETWVATYHAGYVQPSYPDIALADFLCWFDKIGLYRHLRAIYRFSLRYLQDNNDSYLKDIKPALNYVTAALSAQPTLMPLLTWFQRHVLPREFAANTQV